MEVNKDFYQDYAYRKNNENWGTTSINDANFVCSNNMLSFIGSEIDNTITYASSNSRYASKNHAITYGAIYASQTTPKIQPDSIIFKNITNNSYQGVYLCRCDGNITNTNSSNTTIFINGEFSTTATQSIQYANVYPITAFKYHSLVAVPIIGYCSTANTGNNSITFCDYETWLNVDKTNKVIVSLKITLLAGNETSRTNIQI